MPSAKACSKCGAELPSHIQEGLCPKCSFLQAVFQAPPPAAEMSPSGEVREESITRQALGRPLPERQAFIETACAGDGSLLQRVVALLRAKEAKAATKGTAVDVDALRERVKAALTPEMVSPIGEPTSCSSSFGLAPEFTADERPGTVIGRYRLLEKIGEGGFGSVYVAEQRDPVKRRVALKIIKLGMDTRQVVARFEAERQALALMDHPNIAKVFDGGSTEQGRPYFVMELVKGVPITQYCDENNLSTEKRLELFTQTCQAIQHAHQKGVIHRDIKPSNILVTLHDAHGEAVPKVIDFGIAKATQAGLTDKTVYTNFRQFIGTPAYVSPEQAEMGGLDVDTRSDIYSLGVLLYELLVGKTPFDTKELLKAGLDAMRKAIREQEPARPSTRLIGMPQEEQTTTARQRGAETTRLISLLRGDLDWVVMKCLEKDRTLRYDTANALATDVERFLKSEPVVARPPNAGYRFQRLVRRNKLAFAAGGAVAASLVLGFGLSTWLFFKEKKARNNETKLRSRAEESEKTAKREASLAERARLAEREAAQRAIAFSERLQLKRVEEATAVGDTSTALTLLARILRDRPENRVAAERLLSALAFGPIAVARAGSMRHQYSWITTARFSPDGLRALTGSGDGNVRIWDTTSGHLLLDLTNRVDTPWAEFSPDGSRIATGSQDKCVRIWDASTGRLLAEPIRHPDRIYFIAFSPDGSLLASASLEGAAHVWNAFTGASVAGPFLHKGPVWSAVFDPQGERIITASADHTACVWNPRTGEKVGPTVTHSGEVMHACFSHDGRRIATASDDGTACVWDASTGEPVTPSLGHGQRVWFVEFSPNDRLLVTASRDGTARMWNTASG